MNDLADLIRYALAFDLLLVLAEDILKPRCLPLGKSHLAQIGAVLIVAIFIHEVIPSNASSAR